MCVPVHTIRVQTNFFGMKLIANQYILSLSGCQRIQQLEDAKVVFKNYQGSRTHCDVMEAVIIPPKKTSDVSELLSTGHREEKDSARNMLKTACRAFQLLLMMPKANSAS